MEDMSLAWNPHVSPHLVYLFQFRGRPEPAALCAACVTWLGLPVAVGQAVTHGSCGVCRDGALRVPPETPDKEVARYQAFLAYIGAPPCP